jgi:hypothetical protein
MLAVLSLRVHEYIPTPMRCQNCQKFGHKSGTCTSTKPTCPRCAGDHVYSLCPNKESTPACSNCGEQHSAAYKGCSSFQNSQSSLAYAVRNGVSYRDAVRTINTQKTETQTLSTIKSSIASSKSDASTQTESSTETETDSSPSLNQQLMDFIKTTSETINWILTQIKVANANKLLLTKLKTDWVVVPIIGQPPVIGHRQYF